MLHPIEYISNEKCTITNCGAENVIKLTVYDTSDKLFVCFDQLIDRNHIFDIDKMSTIKVISPNGFYC